MSRSGSRALGQCDARVRQRAAARAAEKWPHKFCPRTGWRRARMRDGPSATSTTFVFSGFIAIVAFCAAVRDSLRGLGVGVSSVALARPLSLPPSWRPGLGGLCRPVTMQCILGECAVSVGRQRVRGPRRSFMVGAWSEWDSCLCYENTVDTSLKCGHLFCRACVDKSLKRGIKTCATCRAPVVKYDLRTVYGINSATPRLS